MAENSGISWTHNTQNFWVGCDKVAPECAKCYIGRILSKQHREAWGKVYRTQTWEHPWKWERECLRIGKAKRVFTCSLSDFFHIKADSWRREAWAIIKRTPHLVWLVLTKRPELIEARLPLDWGNGYPNVWLGVSTGCRQTLNKMDTLRRIPAVVRWISAEPLIEDISADINLDGFQWVVAGGESGKGKEYLWKPDADWKAELKNHDGRRTMKYRWAADLRDRVKTAGLPFMFKQVTAPTNGFGHNSLEGEDWHEFRAPPTGFEWAPRQEIPTKYKMTAGQIAAFKNGLKHPFVAKKFRSRPWKIAKPMKLDDRQTFNLLKDRFAKGYRGAAADLRLFLSGRPDLRAKWKLDLTGDVLARWEDDLAAWDVGSAPAT